MQHSEYIHDLAASLAKAQAVMEGAAKDATNPHFKSRYATLASVWDAARKPLASNGLAVIQTARADGAIVTVETMLTHSSGQWVSDALSTTVRDAGPQAIGSGISYLRRYSLAAMVGIAPEDDDAESAQPHRVVDVRTGEDVPVSEAPPAPAGYHYVTGYNVNNEWHEATVLKWDAQGGGLKVSTKKAQVGALLGKFAQEGTPVKVDVTMKKNGKGEAYLNAINSYTVATAPAAPPLTEDFDVSSIPF